MVSKLILTLVHGEINMTLTLVHGGNKTLFDLFDLMPYVHGKQLRIFWDGQLLNHTVPAQNIPEAAYHY